MKQGVSLSCLNPRGVIKVKEQKGLFNARVANLAGKKIGLFWDGKHGGDNFMDVVMELLKKRYPTASVWRVVWGDSKVAEKAKDEADTFIYGVGDSGIGAWLGVYQTIELEKHGKPGVFVLANNGIHNAKLAAENGGMPMIRMVTVPDLEYYNSRISKEDVRPVAEVTIDAVIHSLTQPLTPEELNPVLKQKKGEIVKATKITAENYEAALEKFNQLFLSNHWGDGLPLIPPTEEAVSRMLTGTKRSPYEVIGTVPPQNGIATIEKIAINAVMAGAKPEYLPVIIAAMEGLTDKNFALHHVMTSEGSFTLLIMVGGPIAKKINMNSGVGLLGHGWQANNTIGRAIRLSLLNIGPLWPAEYDMALIGRPSSHTFYTFAENEEYNPWESYPVSQGYSPEDSCVTVSAVGGHGDIGLKIYGGGAVEPWTVEMILNNIIKDVANDRRIFALYKSGVGNPYAHPRKHIIVLHPELAIKLQGLGFTRQSLRNYIVERTSVLYEELSPEELRGIKDRITTNSGGAFGGADAIPEEQIPVFKEALKTGGKVPVVVKPEDIHIIVAGGIPGYSFGMVYFRTAHQTRLVC